MSPESPDEIHERYTITSEHRLHPCTWIPPEWEGPNPPTLANTVTEDVEFQPVSLACQREPEQHPGEDEIPTKPPKGKTHGFSKWVHPDSDFSHNDPELFNNEDLETVRQNIGATSNAYKKLTKVFGGSSGGMQRLACIFEWILCKSSELLADINAGIGQGIQKKAPSKTLYDETREKYIAFLADLEDHEPRFRGRDIEPGEPGRSGYGHALKWVHIFPVIISGKIIGIRVVAQWNPHSSSNGIPIKHNPPP